MLLFVQGNTTATSVFLLRQGMARLPYRLTLVATSASPLSSTMTATIPTTALLLPSSAGATIQSSIAFWAPTLTSAYRRLSGPNLFYIGVRPPFSTASRRASFANAQKLLAALYALVCELATTHDAIEVDARIVFLSDEDAAFGPVMSLEQLADLMEWDQLFCPRCDVGYLLQGQFLASTSSPGVRVYYVDAPGAAATGADGEADSETLRNVEGEEHTVVAGGCCLCAT
jgi:hypothetical protein